MNPEQMEAYMNQRPSSLSTAAKTALLSGGAGYGIDAGMGLMSGAGKQSFKAAIPSAVVSGGAGAGISLVQSAMRKKEMNRMMAETPLLNKTAGEFDKPLDFLLLKNAVYEELTNDPNQIVDKRLRIPYLISREEEIEIAQLVPEVREFLGGRIDYYVSDERIVDYLVEFAHTIKREEIEEIKRQKQLRKERNRKNIATFLPVVGGATLGVKKGYDFAREFDKPTSKGMKLGGLIGTGIGVAGIPLSLYALRKNDEELEKLLNKQANDFSKNQIKNIPTKGLNNAKNEEETQDLERKEAERKKKVNAAAFPVALGAFSGALSGAEHAQNFHRPILKEMSIGGLVGGAAGAATIPLSLYAMKKSEEMLERKRLEGKLNKQASVLFNARRALNNQVKGGLF